VLQQGIDTNEIVAGVCHGDGWGSQVGCPGVRVPQRRADGVDNVSRPSICCYERCSKIDG
jgi:hypothetical protein